MVTAGGGLADFEPEAAAWIAGVEAADGEALETGVRDAVDTFVAGCKTDGNFSKLWSCGIFRGPRTLAGLLHPLVGAVPDNTGFVLGDYVRDQGLAGNASSKRLLLPIAHQGLPQNSIHESVFVDTASSGSGQVMIGAGGSSLSFTEIQRAASNITFYGRAGSADTMGGATDTGFMGLSRGSSGSFSGRVAGTTTSFTRTSVSSRSEFADRICLFAENYQDTFAAFTDARLGFYSAGLDLNLTTFGPRVETLMSSIAAAIP
jgi:hypothetical protein